MLLSLPIQELCNDLSKVSKHLKGFVSHCKPVQLVPDMLDDVHIRARGQPWQLIDLVSLEPLPSKLWCVLGIIVLLENYPWITCLTHFEVFESSQELIFDDFDIIWCLHNPLNLVKPPHSLSYDAPLYHNLPTSMFDHFLDKFVIIGLFWPEPCILASIWLE